MISMLALPYDYFLVSLLFLDVPITVIVLSLILTSFLNYLTLYIRVQNVSEMCRLTLKIQSVHMLVMISQLRI